MLIENVRTYARIKPVKWNNKLKRADKVLIVDKRLQPKLVLIEMRLKNPLIVI